MRFLYLLDVNGFHSNCNSVPTNDLCKQILQKTHLVIVIRLRTGTCKEYKWFIKLIIIKNNAQASYGLFRNKWKEISLKSDFNLVFLKDENNGLSGVGTINPIFPP